jgi:hypothetical protein
MCRYGRGRVFAFYPRVQLTASEMAKDIDASLHFFALTIVMNVAFKKLLITLLSASKKLSSLKVEV